MRRSQLLPALLLLSPGIAAAAAAQSTRAERTGYAETSTHADVLAFIDSLKARGAAMRVWSLATSPAGREVPVVLIARPLVSTPEEARRSGKPLVYIQANIHAGEIEGKEAAQMLLRDLTLGPLKPLLDSVVILLVPIYNTDGNEAFAAGEVNRPGQNGPALVGRRANGQGLDLNRDYVKMEAPETRGAAALLERWRPDLFIDLHTTNGSYHGYNLTFSPGLNANHTPANTYMQDVFLPAIRERMVARHHEQTFPYGNFRNQTPDSLVLGWDTYDGRARYGTNWFALRGGLSILSEAYSNDPLQTRVETTYHFVREILRLLVERKAALRALLARGVRADSVALRQRLADSTMQDVVAEVTSAEPGGGSGEFARRHRTGTFRTVRMPVWDRFTAARSVAVPVAYLVPARLTAVLELLRRQGIVLTPVERTPAGLERFAIDSLRRAPNRFEGHNAVTLQGRWLPAAGDTAHGWYRVDTSQRLGLFAAYLLEPASEDGVVAWNFVDAELAAGGTYPILRLGGGTAPSGRRP